MTIYQFNPSKYYPYIQQSNTRTKYISCQQNNINNEMNTQKYHIYLLYQQKHNQINKPSINQQKKKKIATTSY